MNTRIFKSALVAIAACMVCASCEDEMKPSFPNPVIIESVTDVQEIITFSANMDWELSVPAGLYSYFWIDDSERGKVSKVKGGPGMHTVRIGITDEPDFDNDIRCEVTLSMGGQKSVIAEYTLRKATRDFDVYPASVDVRGFFGFLADGGIAYETEKTDAVSIAYHKNYGFSIPVKFDAGVHYDVTWPDWLEPSLLSDVAVGRRGVCSLMLKVTEGTAIPSETALEGDIIVKVRNSDEVLKTIPVTFEPVRDFVSWEGDNEILFDGKGNFSDTSREYKATLYSTEGVVVFAAARFKVAGAQGEIWIGEDVPWVTIDNSSWNSDGEFLQHYEISISMDANVDSERTADIYAVPASVAKTVSDNASVFVPATHALNSSWTDVKEEIKPYKVATLIQEFGGDLITLVLPTEGATLSEVESKYFNTNISSLPGAGEDNGEGSENVEPEDETIPKYRYLSNFSVEDLYLLNTTSKSFTVGAVGAERALAYEFISAESVDAYKFIADEKQEVLAVEFSGADVKVTIKPARAFEGFIVFQSESPYGGFVTVSALWIEYIPAKQE